MAADKQPRRTLGDLQYALQELGAAVSRDDRDAYLHALSEARDAGASDAQIKDAHAYRSKLRPSGLPWVSFDWDGSKR